MTIRKPQNWEKYFHRAEHKNIGPVGCKLKLLVDEIFLAQTHKCNKEGMNNHSQKSVVVFQFLRNFTSDLCLDKQSKFLQIKTFVQAQYFLSGRV